MNHADPPKTNKPLWFTWDFVQRTRHILQQIDADKLDGEDAKALEAYDDVLGRCFMTGMIIGDASGKMVETMVGEKAVDFGEEARRKARALKPGEPAVGA